jgi:hypothetical protein
MKAERATNEPPNAVIHEAGFVAAFVIPDKRSRYSE